MTMNTTLWLMFGTRFGPLFGEGDGPVVHELLDFAMVGLKPEDTVVIGSAYGFDKVVLDYLAQLAEPPHVRLVAPYKGATATWPAHAAKAFLEQVADLGVEESWVAERHRDGVYSQRDAFVLSEAQRAWKKNDEVMLKAICLWPGNPGVLADTIRGAVALGASTINLWPYLLDRR